MADTYKELTEAYEVVEGIDGITATRSFHDDGGTVHALPAIGDRLSDDSRDPGYNTHVVTRIKTKYGGHPNKHLWTIQYSSNPSSGPSTSSPKTNISDLPMQANIAGELLSVNNATQKKYQWTSGSVIDQTIPIRIGGGSFTLSKRVAVVKLETLFKSTGYVNSTEMKLYDSTFPVGTILFEGVNANEYYNNEGLRRWKLDFTFSVKMMPTSLTADGTEGGWNYLLNESSGKFEKIHADTPIYYSGNLNILLSAPENP